MTIRICRGVPAIVPQPLAVAVRAMVIGLPVRVAWWRLAHRC